MREPQTQRGATLIEILVTLLIFTVGLLGIAAMQLNALRGSTDSAQRSQATWVLQDIVERIRANPEGTANNYAAAVNCAALPAQMCADHYNPSSNQKVNASNCTAAQLAAFDRWEAQCSYADIAAFNTQNGRFTSRDFLNTPNAGSTLSISNNAGQLLVTVTATGKADTAKGKTINTDMTHSITVQR